MKPEPNPYETAGKVLRAMREGAGLSQNALAKAAGIDRSHLTRVESGKSTFSPEFEAKVLKAIADHLHHGGEL